LCIPSSTFNSPGKRRRRKEEGKINNIPHNFSMICGVPYKWNTLMPIMQRLDTGVNEFLGLVSFMITRSFVYTIVKAMEEKE
jgi:hypothetical protein